MSRRVWAPDYPWAPTREPHEIALRDSARARGLDVRVGRLTGECTVRAGDVQGIAVHVASRVCDPADGGDLRVSGTVRDLSVGSDLRFRDRGARPLKGLGGDGRTYSVEGRGPLPG